MVTVKTYPSPSDKYGETVCVAGVRTDSPTPSWIRLYPVRFRYSDGGYQFKKYERISVDIVAHGSKDPRVESFRPDADSIESLGVVQSDGDTWTNRRVLVGGLIGETTTCALIATNRAHTMDQAAPSLGLVKPTVTRVELLQGEEWNANQQAKVDRASQPTLMGDELTPLEPAPLGVRYHYRCAESGCPGHKQKVIDWELGQAGRRWIREVGEKEAAKRVRAKWQDELCAVERDTHFYIGNQHQRRTTFSVLGTWYARPEEPTLF